MSASGASADHSFFWRKLHSFTGVFPIGVYLAAHFWSNSYALVSIERYNEVARGLQQLPWRLAIEIAVIWLPILFHGLYGIYIWWKGKSNALEYPWMANWAWVLQRWSGLIAFLFIGWHVYQERFLTGGMSTYASTQESMREPYFFAFYLVGVTASSFHLGNGLWNFLCKWGIVSTRRSQRASIWLGAAVAVLFTAVGIAIASGFYFDVRPLGSYVPAGAE